jgi:hypothetical protein
MARSDILTGARAKVRIYNRQGRPVTIGLFNNCSWSIRQEKQPVFGLGRYNPMEITPTTQEAIQMTLTGFRVVGRGPYAVMNATMLKDLLNEEDFVVEIIDRRNPQVPIWQAKGCRVTGWSSGVAARGISDVRVDVVGIVGTDEFGIAAGGDDDQGSGGEPGANLLDS